jgi:hypothetical protein
MNGFIRVVATVVGSPEYAEREETQLVNIACIATVSPSDGGCHIKLTDGRQINSPLKVEEIQAAIVNSDAASIGSWAR